MRIAMIGPFGLAPKGTMSARALPLAHALAAKGHHVKVFMPPWHTPQAAGTAWQEGDVALEYVSLAPSWPVVSELAASWRLVRGALAWRPDVVHCFKPKAHAGLAAWALWHLRRLRRGTLRLVVDEDDWEGPGGWNDLEPYPGWLRHVFAHQERWGLTHCDAVTVASRALETLTWSLGVDPQQVHYLPNGAVAWRPGDGDRVRQRYGLMGMPVVLLYTRFFESDPARAVEVFRAIAVTEPEARFLVVGKALFAEDDARFDDLLRDAGLEARTVRTGWTPLEELPDHLAAADVAVQLMDDTLVNRCKCSVKLAELLACGVPVVADAVGQSAEMIRHGETGLLVLAGEVRVMAEQVVALLRDPHYRAGLGRAAELEMATRYSWAGLADYALCAYGIDTEYTFSRPHTR
jgi:glycosyltransferase involved in cell wall biosynthesis